MFIHFSDLEADYIYNTKFIENIIRKHNADYFTIMFTSYNKTFKFKNSTDASMTYFHIITALEGNQEGYYE